MKAIIIFCGGNLENELYIYRDATSERGRIGSNYKTLEKESSKTIKLVYESFLFLIGLFFKFLIYSISFSITILYSIAEESNIISIIAFIVFFFGLFVMSKDLDYILKILR